MKNKKLISFYVEDKCAAFAVAEAVRKVNEYFDGSTHVIQNQSHSVVATTEGFCATVVVLIEEEIRDAE